MVQTQRCVNSFQIFPTLKVGYADNFAATMDASCSRMGQVSVTRHSRRMLLQTLLNSYIKQSKDPLKTKVLLLYNQMRLC